MTDISIIIVNWNTKNLVVDCVNSILSSKPVISYEIIVVDNGSTDGSNKAFKKLKNIKLILNKSNLGFAKANNIGIKKSKGKYVLLLNSDTLVSRGSLDKLIEFALEHSDTGVIGAKLLNRNKTLQKSVFRLPTLYRTIKQYWFNQKNILEKYAPKEKTAMEVEAVVGAAFLITPEAIKKTGLLNGNYFMYFEDLDYCRRVMREGLKVYYLPTVKIIHYHGESGKQISNSTDQWKRLIPSSKIYHGLFKYYLIWFVMWSGQKLHNAKK